MLQDDPNPVNRLPFERFPKGTLGFLLPAAAGTLLLFSFLLDDPVRSVLRHHQTPFFVNAMQWITRGGGILTLLGLSLTLLAMGYGLKIKPLRRCGGTALLAVLLSSLITEGIKFLTGHPRPFLSDPGGTSWGPTTAPGFDSFPSGHSASIFAFAGILIFFYPRARILLTGIAVLIAFSRLYLDVHFFSDVIAGTFLGMGTAAFLIQGIRSGRPWRPRGHTRQKPVDRESQ